MTLYEVAGGSAGILAMTRRFYEKAVADPLLGELFAGKPEHADHIAGYLIHNFGRPDDYLRERGDLRFVLEQHEGMAISEEQRARWVHLMLEAARETGKPPAFLEVFSRYVDFASRRTRDVSELPAGAIERRFA